MNRAWIPAGALAGVSVAGLIALGPLTDSLNTQVTFPSSIAAATNSKPVSRHTTVPVSITVKRPVGNIVVSAALSARGGSSSSALSTSGDAGQVAYQKFHSTSSGTTATTTHATTNVATPPATTKKAPKRQTTIGTIGEPNSDAGLAGGSKSSTSLGEQSSTPAP
jgi:hypothetical protein